MDDRDAGGAAAGEETLVGGDHTLCHVGWCWHGRDGLIKMAAMEIDRDHRGAGGVEGKVHAHAVANSQKMEAMYFAPSIRWSMRMFSSGAWLMQVT